MNNTTNTMEDIARHRNIYNAYQQEVQYCEEKCKSLDNKAATIIGFIGVIFGLQVSLLSLYYDTLSFYSGCFPVVFAIFFTLELILFLFSIFASGLAYHVKYDKSNRPNIVNLADKILEKKCENDVSFIKENIDERKRVLSKLQDTISNKKNWIDWAQVFFMFGCIVSIIMLIVLIWAF